MRSKFFDVKWFDACSKKQGINFKKFALVQVNLVSIPIYDSMFVMSVLLIERNVSLK